MNLRIARKIYKRIGYGYPITNFGRLYEAIHVWEKACKRFKHFKRNVTMRRKLWRKLQARFENYMKGEKI